MFKFLKSYSYVQPDKYNCLYSTGYLYIILHNTTLAVAVPATSAAASATAHHQPIDKLIDCTVTTGRR
jgi:hypothetical protein